MEETANQSQEAQTGEVGAGESTYTESLSQKQEPNQDEQATGQPAQEAGQEPEKPGPIKVKYNHEEKEIPYDEATTLIQKGMNYDKVHGRLSELEATIKTREAEMSKLIAGFTDTQRKNQEMAQDQQFKTAVQQIAAKWQADPEAIAQIIQEALPHHPIAAEANQLKQQFGQVLTQQQEQEHLRQQGLALKKAYPDVDFQKIPLEVFRMNKEEGIPLLAAYQIHEANQLREEVAGLKQALEAKKKNAENAETSPGSVTGQGATKSDYISKETFEQNKGDRNWVIKNLSKITKSRAKWRG